MAASTTTTTTVTPSSSSTGASASSTSSRLSAERLTSLGTTSGGPSTRRRYIRSNTASVTQLLSDSCSSILQRFRRNPSEKLEQHQPQHGQTTQQKRSQFR